MKKRGMIFLTVLAFCVGAVICWLYFGDVPLAWLIDMPTLLLLLCITVPVLMSAGVLRDFGNVFRFVIGKKKADGIRELRRAEEAVSMAVKTIWYVAILISVAECIKMLTHLDDPTKIGPILCVSILVVLYAAAINILLISMRTQLRIQLIEYLSREE